MLLARVTGLVVATPKAEELEGLRFALLQPLGADLEPRSRSGALGQRAERRREAELIERRRTQLGDEPPQRVDVSLKLVDRIPHQKQIRV